MVPVAQRGTLARGARLPESSAESLRPRALRGVCARRPAPQLRALLPGHGTTRRDLYPQRTRAPDPTIAGQRARAAGVAVRGRSAVHEGHQAAAEDDAMSRTTPLSVALLI